MTREATSMAKARYGGAHTPGHASPDMRINESVFDEAKGLRLDVVGSTYFPTLGVRAHAHALENVDRWNGDIRAGCKHGCVQRKT